MQPSKVRIPVCLRFPLGLEASVREVNTFKYNTA
jgi:hypothetical protein